MENEYSNNEYRPVSAQNGFVGSRYGLSGSTLKLIACATMLIDHTGAALVNQIISSGSLRQNDYETWQKLVYLYKWMRGIGRLAFPIFCFLIVEGFFHTRSVRKYCERMFLFALISEFPFDYALKVSGASRESHPSCRRHSMRLQACESPGRRRMAWTSFHCTSRR